jgi:KUP system potassium uptake protein
MISEWRCSSGFLALAAVVLVVTGSEALYADLGQFSRRSIRVGWIFVVFPALIINFLGQGALILRSPTVISTPFFGLFLKWAAVPIVVVAVAAVDRAAGRAYLGKDSAGSRP